ncbi:MAG: lysophospholipid acyltransferase family protein, partial [Candidatus Limnocylindrales bacterium]
MLDGADLGSQVFVDPRHDPLPAWRRTFRYQLMRVLLWTLLRTWFRFRREGFGRLPAGAYVVCMNHPGWLDPMVVYAVWPARPRVHIYGPKETDMRVGWRNRLISWLGFAVPFVRAMAKLLTSAKRAVDVLEAGRVLVVA